VNTVHVAVPEGLDDPARPSGGNVYDRRVCDGLAAAGWDVRELRVPRAWPRPAATNRAELARLVAGVPDGGLLVVDGLLASGADDVLVPAARRLRLVVLVHLPQEGEAEAAVLGSAHAVLTTSDWTRRRLAERYGLRPERLFVAHPGVDLLEPATRTDGGARLLCVGAVAPHKGQDVLLTALADLTDRRWTCTLVGSLDVDPAFTARMRDQAAGLGVRFAGPHTGAALRRDYRAADVLLLPSRGETYGMVAAEALSAGVPVIASDVGGVPEALGRTDRGLPGLLVPPGNPRALAAAIAAWLENGELRRRLRSAAAARRATLEPWTATVANVAAVLHAAAGEPARGQVRVPG